MTKRKKLILTGVGLIAVVAIVCFVFLLRGSGTSTEGVYVQKISDLNDMSSYSYAQRFTGVTESQESLEIKLDTSKTVKEVYVEVGQNVKKGDALFTYDVTSVQRQIEQTQLDIEGLNNNISDYNKYISQLTGTDSQTTIQKQQYQMQIRQAEIDIQSKQNDLTHYQEEINNATITSTIDGVVKQINQDGGTDSNGNELPVISVAQTGEFRIKGTVDEQNIGVITSGMTVLIRSRIDENQTWYGTVSKIDTDPQSSNSDSYYSSGESASKYSFYVSLNSSEGLMLGQHVFIEPLDEYVSEPKDGVWINDAFIAYDEDGNPYVWASINNKLKKVYVELGEMDETDYSVEILSGLTEDDAIAYPDDTYQEGDKTIDSSALFGVDE